MADQERTSLPEATASDYVLGFVKAGAALIPGVGGAVVELANILGTPLERRRVEWFSALGEDVRKLKSQIAGLTDQKLSENREFVSAVLHATQIAGRTHQQEKLDALRNAVLNTAAGSAPGGDKQAMFLSAVDSLTSFHIRVVAKLAAQDAPLRTARLATEIRPSGAGDDTLVQLVRDLRNRGFVDFSTALDQLDVGTIGETGVQLTAYGAEFLEFITSPLAEQGQPSGGGTV